jgi:hypothetical protein
MAHQAPENGGFQFRSGFVVDRHGRGSRWFTNHMGIRWELSQILPYLRAKGGIPGGIPVSHSAGNALPAVDRSGRVTRNRQSFDVASLHDCKRFPPPSPC